MKLTPRFLDGVAMAASAIPNARVIVDAHRCELEREFMLDTVHDWYACASGRGPYARDRKIFAPNWANNKLVTGTEDELRRQIRVLSERFPGEPILVCRSALSLLISTDVQGVAEAMAAEISNPILFIERESTDDDWIDGWRHTHEVVWEAVVREDGSHEPRVRGFCLFRLEGDETGNIDEIERLWSRMGLGPVAWPFCGRRSSFEPVSPRALQITFPFVSNSASADQTLAVPLPIGVESTCEFLRAVAQRFDKADAAEQLIATETAEVEERLLPFVSHVIAGRGFVVVGDPWTAAALCSAVRELGGDVPMAVVLRRGDADDAAPDMASHADEVWQDPQTQEVQGRLLELAELGLCDAVVGAALLRDAAERAGLPSVEVAGPHYLEHFASPNPYMGFQGMLRLAERVSNAIMQGEHRRRFPSARSLE